jgi:hypothetical protein
MRARILRLSESDDIHRSSSSISEKTDKICNILKLDNPFYDDEEIVEKKDVVYMHYSRNKQRWISIKYESNSSTVFKNEEDNTY